MIFHIKLYVLDSIKYLDLLEFMMDLDIQYYLALKKCDAISNRIRYLISTKSGITDVFSHHYAKVKVDSYDFLPIEKILALHNVIIHIKSIPNEDKGHYHYKIFLEKRSYQLAKKYSLFFFYSIIMLRFGETKIAREKFYAA